MNISVGSRVFVTFQYQSHSETIVSGSKAAQREHKCSDVEMKSVPLKADTYLVAGFDVMMLLLIW